MWTGKSDEFVDRASAGTEARQHRALSDRGTSSADDCAVGRDGNAVARTVSFRRIQYHVDCCNSTRSHVYTRSDNLSGSELRNKRPIGCEAQLVENARSCPLASAGDFDP